MDWKERLAMLLDAPPVHETNHGIPPATDPAEPIAVDSPPEKNAGKIVFS